MHKININKTKINKTKNKYDRNEKKTQWWRKGVGVWGGGADYKIHRTFVPFGMVMFSFIFLQSFNKIVRFF